MRVFSSTNVYIYKDIFAKNIRKKPFEIDYNPTADSSVYIMIAAYHPFDLNKYKDSCWISFL